MKRFLWSILFFALVCIFLPLSVHAQYHMTPNGSGTRDGSSLANAAPLRDLQKLTLLLNGIGGTITLYPGAYTNIQALVAGSGSATTPILIQGLNSNNPNTMALFNNGSKIFIQDGISNVFITNIRFETTDRCIVPLGNMTNVTIQNMLVKNVDYFFDGGIPGSINTSNTITMNNIKVEGYTSSVFRFVGSTQNIDLGLIYISAEASNYNPTVPSQGAIEFHDSVSNVTIQLATIINKVDKTTTVTQPNTDGIWAGPNTDNITISNTYISGFTDGGFDLASKHVSFTTITVVANRANMILEQAAANAFTIVSLISLNPTDSHFQATDNDVDTIIASVTNSLLQTGPTAISPTVPTGQFIVDSRRCAIVSFAGGTINHGDNTPATRIRDTNCATATDKATFNSVALGPAPAIVNVPPAPDNTTVGGGGGPAGPANLAKSLAGKDDPLGLFWYFFAATIYIMFIHLAFAIQDQFKLHNIIGIFIFGALIGWVFHRFEIGFIVAIILSMLFW